MFNNLGEVYARTMKIVAKTHPKTQLRLEMDLQVTRKLKALAKKCQYPPDTLAEHLLEEALQLELNDPAELQALRDHLLDEHIFHLT